MGWQLVASYFTVKSMDIFVAVYGHFHIMFVCLSTSVVTTHVYWHVNLLSQEEVYKLMLSF